MASELSKLIEDQLRANGLAVEEEDEEQGKAQETIALLGDPLAAAAASTSAAASASSSDPEAAAAAHSTLMGALRVEARVKEQQAQRSLQSAKRSICIGGGIAIVLSIFLLLVLMSSRGREGGAHAGTAWGNRLHGWHNPSPAWAMSIRGPRRWTGSAHAGVVDIHDISYTHACPHGNSGITTRVGELPTAGGLQLEATGPPGTTVHA